MPPQILAPVFLAVMGAAVACFWAAAATRKSPRRHVRWALLGAGLEVAGTLAVFVTSRFLGWRVPAAFPAVAVVHRAFAYAATALLAVQAATGFARARPHAALGVVFLAVVTITYGLAIWAYGLGG